MYKVGIGYDMHRFEKGRRLVIGGVNIDYHSGLAGHSDADVLVHAIIDALLGAASLGDIGIHFPDTNSEYLGISSLKLLERVKQMLDKAGYVISNIDVVIIAQRPKMYPYIGRMKEKLSEVLDISVEQLNIKATTTEGLGLEGRGEGISAQAVALVAGNML